jgi:hypothetical protein
MKIPLHVLIVEDSEDDTALIVRALRNEGFDPSFNLVETKGAMEAA